MASGRVGAFDECEAFLNLVPDRLASLPPSVLLGVLTISIPIFNHPARLAVAKVIEQKLIADHGAEEASEMLIGLLQGDRPCP